MTRRVPSPTSGPQKADVITATLAMARSHHTQGRLGLAEGCYRQVLSLDANNAEALHLLGVVALQSNAAEDAVKLIKRAIRRSPRDAAMFVNLGAAHRKLKQLAEARDAYKAAVKLVPQFADAYFNLSKVLLDLEEPAAAVEAGQKCVSLDPKRAEALLILGNAYKHTGDKSRALAAYEEALRLAPQLAEAYGNVASVHIDRCEFARALELLNQGLAIDPHSGDLKVKRAMVHLRMGNLAQGWDDYEGRYSAEFETMPRFDAPPPYWNGEDLGDKTLLVGCEQGIGDSVIYGSMIGDAVARARACIIECTPRMVPVFARSFPTAKVVSYVSQRERTTPASEFDTQIGVTSLGRFFRRDMADFPRHRGYLKADPARAAAFRARYQAIAPGNLVVGLSWRSVNKKIGEPKSADLADWADVLKVPGVTFVNLQYGDCAADLKAAKEKLGVDVVQDPDVDSMKNMDDFFAQVAAMDLVITTSNTTVHVAGSLDIPAWLILNTSLSALWYWFLDRTDSPWYPSVRIFRRPTGETDMNTADWWRPAVKEIGKALTAKVQGSG